MQHIDRFGDGHLVRVQFLDTIKLGDLILIRTPYRKEVHVCKDP